MMLTGFMARIITESANSFSRAFTFASDSQPFSFAPLLRACATGVGNAPTTMVLPSRP